MSRRINAVMLVLYIIVAAIGLYMSSAAASEIPGPLACQATGLEYKLDPQKAILEYKARVVDNINADGGEATITYRVVVLNSPCEGSILYGTEVTGIDGKRSLAGLLYGMGLLVPGQGAPYNVTATTPDRFPYIVPVSVLELPSMTPGVGGGEYSIYSSSNYIATRIVPLEQGTVMVNLVKASFDADTGILSELEIAYQTNDGRNALVDIELASVNYVTDDRIVLSEASALTSSIGPSIAFGLAIIGALYTGSKLLTESEEQS